MWFSKTFLSLFVFCSVLSCSPQSHDVAENAFHDCIQQKHLTQGVDYKNIYAILIKESDLGAALIDNSGKKMMALFEKAKIDKTLDFLSDADTSLVTLLNKIDVSILEECRQKHLVDIVFEVELAAKMNRVDQVWQEEKTLGFVEAISLMQREGVFSEKSFQNFSLRIKTLQITLETINTEEGILRMLPPMEEAINHPEVKERNVLVVSVNGYNDLMVEGEIMTDISQLKNKAIEFMTNPNNSENLPVKRFISEKLCKQNLTAARQAKNIEGIAKWEHKLAAVNLVSEFWEEPNAVISLENDRGTSYGVYLEVQDQLQEAVNELRNSLSKKAFGVPFSELDDELEADKEKIRAIRTAIPQRISEVEPRDVQTIE